MHVLFLSLTQVTGHFQLLNTDVSCNFLLLLILDGPVVDTNMEFTLTSSRDADPPVFTLTFNSSFGPPTVVECTRDNQLLNASLYEVSREVLEPQYVLEGEPDSVNASEPDMPDVTRVTVTVREREAGEYMCNVTVMGMRPMTVLILGNASSITNVTGELYCIQSCI